MSFIYIPVTGGGPPIPIPVPPSDGGTGTTTVFPDNTVIFVDGGAGVYSGDVADFSYDQGAALLDVTNLDTANLDAVAGQIDTLEVITSLELDGFPAGAVLFTDAAGIVDSDVSNLVWNDATNTLTVTNLVVTNPISFGLSDTQVLFGNSSGQIAQDSLFLFDATNNILAIGVSVTTGINASLEIASGIQFPATAVASSDVHVLDDYEEGTWTPTLTPATGSITLLGLTGWYRKVGSTVFFGALIVVLSVSSPTGTLTMGGLPFTQGASSLCSMDVYASVLGAGATTAIQGVINGATTTAQIQRYAAGAAGALSSFVGAGTNISVNGSYYVD